MRNGRRRQVGIRDERLDGLGVSIVLSGHNKRDSRVGAGETSQGITEIGEILEVILVGWILVDDLLKNIRLETIQNKDDDIFAIGEIEASGKVDLILFETRQFRLADDIKRGDQLLYQ